jgi:multidrug efflux pump subunit AcrB
VPQEVLQAYGLTLADIASKIDRTSVEIPGGVIETSGGDILLRVKQRRDWARQFAEIPIITTREGAVLCLRDIATVTDGFEEVDQMATYNGFRSAGLEVYRVGKQTPIGVSDAVKDAMEEISRDLPPGINWAINDDRSYDYRLRLELLVTNACQGLVLVVILLSLFLEFKLAFWATMGIPISFLGAFLFFPGMDVTINMISMFAFIIALGIVVDDAIVVGENVYEYRSRGMGPVESAIQGARDVLVPVSFSIITNIVAFIPLCFVPGMMGKIYKVVPLVVITAFSISWFEALLILPSHLAHARKRASGGILAFLHDRQQAFSRQVIRFIENIYGPFLDRCIRHRYTTVAVGIAILILVAAYVRSGRIGMILMPRVEADRAFVTATLPYGSAFEKASQVCDTLVRAAEKVVAENGAEGLGSGVYAVIEENTVEVSIYLTDPDVRPMSTAQVTQKWREAVGQMSGLESLKFESDRGGFGSGAALTVELSHRDIDVLDKASATLAGMLAEFPNIKDVDDGYTPGKQQLNFTIKPEGESLGLTAYDVARQVRNAFYGAEALRQQRGRNEVKVKVRFPKSHRISEHDIEQLLIRTPSGSDVPLMEIADVKRGRAYTTIERRNARRTVTVTADVDPIDQTAQVMATLDAEVLPQLAQYYPGLSYGYEGRQADLSESTQKLVNGLIFALLGVFVMLAIPFRSYLQPVIVMVSVPFGIVGAVLGHIMMGYSLSLMSLMGIIALSGVVVNDSLVLIDYSNQLRSQGTSLSEAVRLAGRRRFRPIILTSLTTFGGLAPIIFETSRQAKFMIPMALSLGYGILFSTVVALLLVPALCVILQDVQLFFAGARRDVPLVSQNADSSAS